MRTELHFILNNREVKTTRYPGRLVLDYLRETERLIGTKEGCREGDCGACAVLVGELKDGRVDYTSVTSCLLPLGELHGKHLVTVEGLGLEQLSPVQDAIASLGASQCGFCTPGIVVSLTGYLLGQPDDIDLPGVKEALGGHLCRCTGYRSLKDTWLLLRDVLGNHTGVEGLVSQDALPNYFVEIPRRLASIEPPELRETRPGQHIVAGGTDIYVQKGDQIPGTGARVLNRRQDLRQIESDGSNISVGALVTFEQFSNDSLIAIHIPGIKGYMAEIASIQIRNRATLVGNLINASPVGDITILLLALGASIVLTDDETNRTLPLSEFYLGYKELAKAEHEIVSTIQIPLPATGSRINWEKVSKRTYLDIASVNSAAVFEVDGDIIVDAKLTAGGVAPIPLLLAATNSFLVGKSVSVSVVEEACEKAQSEIAPIDDIRGSQIYKRLLVRQMIIAHFAVLFPDVVHAEEVYA